MLSGLRRAQCEIHSSYVAMTSPLDRCCGLALLAQLLPVDLAHLVARDLCHHGEPDAGELGPARPDLAGELAGLVAVAAHDRDPGRLDTKLVGHREHRRVADAGAGERHLLDRLREELVATAV